MFHNKPQKLSKIMRRSTGQYVVLKKLAIGQTLYESQISLKSSCQNVNELLALQLILE